MREMTLEGVASILEGMNPHMLETKIVWPSWWRRIRTRSAPRRPADETPQTHPRPSNHERWLVSYADFITLLFRIFCRLICLSQVDQRKSANWPWPFKWHFKKWVCFRPPRRRSRWISMTRCLSARCRRLRMSSEIPNWGASLPHPPMLWRALPARRNYGHFAQRVGAGAARRNCATPGIAAPRY